MALNRVNASDPRDQLSSARRVETQSRSDFAIPAFAGILRLLLVFQCTRRIAALIFFDDFRESSIGPKIGPLFHLDPRSDEALIGLAAATCPSVGL
ncbi:hypothetical protein CEXT_30891 [Caerostris extrusa]|uniref:Uncharacterized protein n=1 Tax=Caerostris extrusa TaxID=172846 RepID=A0AAV4XQZ1_CAEEX|nr:hypothetical protein CEXT_30891 [Caerostris extrusa]